MISKEVNRKASEINGSETFEFSKTCAKPTQKRKKKFKQILRK